MIEVANTEISEFHALNTLIALGIVKGDQFVHKDKPDFWNERNSYGIEIVRSLYKGYSEKYRFIASVWDKPILSIPKEKLDRFIKMGGKLEEETFENGKFLGKSFLLEERSNSPEHLLETIYKKIEKAKEYHKFAGYGLYVYVGTCYFLGCESFLDTIIEQVGSYPENPYDTLYLDCYFEMYVCSLKTKQYKQYDIPKELR